MNPLNIVPDEVPEIGTVLTEDTVPAPRAKELTYDDVELLDGKNVFVNFIDGSYKVGLFEVKPRGVFTVGHSLSFPLSFAESIRET